MIVKILNQAERKVGFCEQNKGGRRSTARSVVCGHKQMKMPPGAGGGWEWNPSSGHEVSSGAQADDNSQVRKSGPREEGWRMGT